MTDASPEAKKVPIRSLMINTMFSIFIALVVFVIASYAFLLPLITNQQLQIAVLKQRLVAVENAQRAAEEAPPAQAAAPAPSAAVVHASAPAPAPGGPAAVPAVATAPAEAPKK